MEEPVQVQADRLDRARAAQEGYGLRDVGDRDGLDAVHDGGLARVVQGADDAVIALPPALERHGKAAIDRPDAPVEGQLADDREPAVPRRQIGFAGMQQADQDGQFERGPFLAPVGGGEVDRHGAARKREAAVLECGAHPVDALFDTGVRQPHQGHLRHLGPRDVDLDLNGKGLDAEQPHAVDFRQHRAPRVADTSRAGQAASSPVAPGVPLRRSRLS